jgi:hypothetical protein
MNSKASPPIPGLLELRLATQLASDGFDVTLWPDVDRADLAVSMPGELLELDAKVWVSTQALSRHIAQLPNLTPRWIVIPNYQKSHIPSLREHCPPGIDVFTENDCSKELKKHARPF